MTSTTFNTEHAAAKAAGTPHTPEKSLPGAAVHKDHFDFGDNHTAHHAPKDKKAAKGDDDSWAYAPAEIGNSPWGDIPVAPGSW